MGIVSFGRDNSVRKMDSVFLKDGGEFLGTDGDSGLAFLTQTGQRSGELTANGD